MTEESPTSNAISEEEGELEEKSKGGGWWQEWSSQTMLLKHVLGRALESQRTKGDCREAMKTLFND
jgi:hypothetical protein